MARLMTMKIRLKPGTKLWTLIVAYLILCIAVWFLWDRLQSGRIVSANTNVAAGPPQFLTALYGDDGKGVSGNEPAGRGLNRPLAVAVAPDGKIFVADSGNAQIQVFNAKGKKLAAFGQGKLSYPFALALKDNRIFVADPNLMKIFVFDDQGKELAPLLDKKTLPREFSPAPQVIRPTAVQAGSDGLFYVADVANQCILVLDAQGRVIRYFGGPGAQDGRFQYPNGLWVNARGDIYVADSNNGRIQIFDNQGKFMGKIDGTKSKMGQLTLPRGLVVLDTGTILVVDVFLHCVRAFVALGNEQWTLGGMGTDNGKFNFPNGIWLDEQGRLYVTDRENNRVQVFGYKAAQLGERK